MKKYILSALILLSFAVSASAQKKETVKKDSTNTIAKVVGDTVVIASGKLLKLPSGLTIPIVQLETILKSSIVIADDLYWNNLFDLIKSSATSKFTGEQIDQMLASFMPFVSRYKKALQEAAEKQAQKQ